MNDDRPRPQSPSAARLIWDAVLITAMLAFWLALTAPAGAQDEGPPPVNDQVSCGHFQTQADAQEVLVFGELDADGIFALDPDGNGIACEGAFGELDPNSPPPARDYVSCGHFESQADAQEVLDSGMLDETGRASLDGDGDGIACERAFGLDPDSPPPANDHVSCGHFDTQASAQETLDSGLLDENGVSSLDPDGNGIACEHRFGTGSGSSQPAPSSSSAVTTLPKTGSGSSDTAGHLLAAMSAALSLVSGTAWLARKHFAG